MTQFIDSARLWFSGLTSTYKLAFISALVLIALFLALGIGQRLSDAKHARTQAALDKQLADNKIEKEKLEQQIADDAASKAALEIELKQVNNKLLDATAELKTLHEHSQKAEKVYVERKIYQKVPEYFTGDATTDSRLLCAKLAEIGAATVCAPKR